MLTVTQVECCSLVGGACLACLQVDDTPQGWVPAGKPTPHGDHRDLGDAEPVHSRVKEVTASVGRDHGLFLFICIFLAVIWYSNN